MIHHSGQDWLRAANRRVLLFGMSGLGKTHLSGLLRASGGWFHYSIDYRIGTRYLGEAIVDNAKAEAMKVPFLRDLLIGSYRSGGSPGVKIFTSILATAPILFSTRASIFATSSSCSSRGA